VRAAAGVLAPIRDHVAADTCCPRCGHRAASTEDQVKTLIAEIIALPATGRQRTSARTTAERRNGHTEEVTYTISIEKSNPSREGNYAENLRAVASGPG
jgi:hypothetical protein